MGKREDWEIVFPLDDQTTVRALLDIEQVCISQEENGMITDRVCMPIDRAKMLAYSLGFFLNDRNSDSN